MLDLVETKEISTSESLEFLWLELTNRCNLQCVHCYAESGPFVQDDALSKEQYLRVLHDAATAGCREVQFIGGEPTLNPDLPDLIVAAGTAGFRKIEVFTNLNSLSDQLLDCFTIHSVNVATSIYGASAEIHDEVTLVPGSFARLVRNIRRCLERGLKMRAGFIEMAENSGRFEEANAFFSELGVSSIGHDFERKIGRASKEECCGMEELCGECANGTLAVGPDGVVSPCIMSKAWSVGRLGAANSLTDILRGDKLAQTRRDIGRAVGDQRTSQEPSMICTPKTCAPYDATPCSPKDGGCTPCYPKG